MTLKLKNVNFEVKTRAWTLPCAVAASDKLFAVAKDLLTTEIDNVSPQPLRLRLMGNLTLPSPASLNVVSHWQENTLISPFIYVVYNNNI